MKLRYNLFYVADVKASMDFYEKAFQLTKGFLHEEHDYGEMKTDGVVLGFVSHELADKNIMKYRKQSQESELLPFEIGFISDDVERDYNLALSHGAVSVKKPEYKPWGQIVSYVKDLNGFLVEICSSIGG